MDRIAKGYLEGATKPSDRDLLREAYQKGERIFEIRRETGLEISKEDYEVYMAFLEFAPDRLLLKVKHDNQIQEMTLRTFQQLPEFSGLPREDAHLAQLQTLYSLKGYEEGTAEKSAFRDNNTLIHREFHAALGWGTRED